MNDLATFKTFINTPRNGKKYIAHCYTEIPRTYLFDELRDNINKEEITVLIGPEGDFSIDEVEMAIAAGYTSIHLGQSRYRTETAAIAALMMMQLSKNR